MPTDPGHHDWRNLRHLRAVTAVAQHGTVVGAASALHLSQPAVTRSIHTLETALGTQLFLRNPRGMSPTAAGKTLAGHTARALDELQRARAQACSKQSCPGQPAGSDDRFLRGLTYRQLQAFHELAAAGTETQAAKALGLSQPGIHRIIREFEASLGLRLFERTFQGLTLTPAGQALLEGARRALDTLNRVGDALRLPHAVPPERLCIGALPLCNAIFVPRAIEHTLRKHPGLQVRILSGPYDMLMQKLRLSEIDLLAGALRGSLPFPDVQQERLFDDGLMVAVRQDHPLCTAGRLTLADLSHHEWIFPLAGTPAHDAFTRAFTSAGVALPPHGVEANSMELIVALLRGSDRLALVPRSQHLANPHGGPLATLPIDLQHTERAFGVVHRSAQSSSPAIATFKHALQEISSLM